MGWKESSVMHERCRPVQSFDPSPTLRTGPAQDERLVRHPDGPDGFVLSVWIPLGEAMAQGANISELCRSYGVSRKTGYPYGSLRDKWLRRYKQEGPVGLSEWIPSGYEWSRRPRNSPFSTSAHMVAEVVRLRLDRATARGARYENSLPAVRSLAAAIYQRETRTCLPEALRGTQSEAHGRNQY